jgi:tyrosyl-tRNA synthetase
LHWLLALLEWLSDPSGNQWTKSWMKKTAARQPEECVECSYLNFRFFFRSQERMKQWWWTTIGWKIFHFGLYYRDAGKHITINYMMAKDSVKIESPASGRLSFTNLLIRWFKDMIFLHLYRTKDCTANGRKSDQWGNITTRTRLVETRCRWKGLYAAFYFKGGSKERRKCLAECLTGTSTL